MDAVATLSIFAQLAVSLTGFAGLLTAFRSGERPWTFAEVAGIRNLLMTSVGALAFGVLTIPALVGGVPQAIVWTCAALALALFLIVLFAGGTDYVVRLKGRPRSWLFYWFFTIGALPLAALLAASAFDVLPRGSALYCAGLIWLLAIGTVQFMFQIFSTLKPPEA